MKTITKEWLKKNNACSDGYKWFVDQDETDTVKVLRKLMSEDKFDLANWTIVRIFDRKQRIKYAVFAAEQVLGIFEKKYPDDKRPREAIEAARKCIEHNTQRNRDAARDAAWAAWAAAWDAAGDAARTAAWAAGAARDAAGDAAKKAMQTKILKYGISLLEAK